MKCVWEYKGTKQTGRFSKEKCCVLLIIFSPEKNIIMNICSKMQHKSHALKKWRNNN